MTFGLVPGTVMLDGAPLSDGDMDVLMDALAVSTSQKVALTVEKGTESSTICIYPKYYNGEMTDTDVGEIFFTLSAEFDTGTRAASLKLRPSAATSISRFLLTRLTISGIRSTVLRSAK